MALANEPLKLGRLARVASGAAFALALSSAAVPRNMEGADVA